jgi:hypothetical protein
MSEPIFPPVLLPELFDEFRMGRTIAMVTNSSRLLFCARERVFFHGIGVKRTFAAQA